MEELRRVFAQLARFVEGDYSQHPAFYPAQVHALAELATLVRHQALPREAVQLLGGSDLAGQVLAEVIENRSISPMDLANRLSREPQNLVPINEQLVAAGLLHRDECGRRVRFSPTALALAAAQQFRIERESTKLETAPCEFEYDRSHLGSRAMADSLMTVAVARGADSIEIKLNEQTVIVEASANDEKSEYHLPKSAHDALIFGLSRNPRVQLAKQAAIQRRLLKKVTELSHKYTLSTPEAEPGQKIRTDLPRNAVLRRSKQESLRSSFQLLQTAGKNLEAIQRLVVCEAVTNCKGKKTNAAKMLGIKLGKLEQLAHPPV